MHSCLFWFCLVPLIQSRIQLLHPKNCSLVPGHLFKASSSSSFRCTYEWRIDQSCRCHANTGNVLKGNEVNVGTIFWLMFLSMTLNGFGCNSWREHTVYTTQSHRMSFQKKKTSTFESLFYLLVYLVNSWTASIRGWYTTTLFFNMSAV